MIAKLKLLTLTIFLFITSFAQAQSTSDCINAIEICSSGLTEFGPADGFGEIIDSAFFNTCLDLGFGNLESNSTWVKWETKATGYFAFEITPLQETGDLDFVLFKSDEAYDCNSLEEIRCMGSGYFNFPSPCMGPTGLNLESSDVTESPGCLDGDDNFLAVVEASAGEHYVMVINNFSDTESGFHLFFYGTAMLPCDSVPTEPPLPPVSFDNIAETTIGHPFPNPFKSEFIVPISNKFQDADFDIQLYDTRGNLMNVPYSKQSDQLVLETNHLIPGSYFLHINSLTVRQNFHVVKME